MGQATRAEPRADGAPYKDSSGGFPPCAIRHDKEVAHSEVRDFRYDNK